MDRAKAPMLEVWREACRHVDLAESLAAIGALINRQLPIDGLAVLALLWEEGQVVVRATARGPIPIGREGRPLTNADKKRLIAWARRPEVISHRDGAELHEVARLLLPRGATGHWLIGALGNGDHPAGALLLRATPPGRFDATHARLAAELLEPLAVALENDRRFHELGRLREAAEAERHSALTRLGRDDLTEAIIGAEGGLAPVMERTALAAKSDIPVLILGETGAGKELIARAIHERSPRRHQPFIRVNCGAIPPELIDSQLFGHEKGAFTGAVAARRGWFERADQGTLLLDEIGELPLAAQTRLLRVLQEGSFERVGGEETVSANVRIVASTHRDLPAMVQNGAFRQDLWYRIASFPIVLPPLRERRQDIGPLALHLAGRAARRFGLRPIEPTAGDLALLSQYDWPGNVRELASVIDRAAILGDGHSLEIGRALGAGAITPRPLPIPGAGAEPRERLTVQPLDDAVRAHIEAALRQTRGRVDGDRGAARLLEVNPHTLRARMRKLRIDWRLFRSGPG